MKSCFNPTPEDPGTTIATPINNPDTPPSEGERIGPYVVLGAVARGGMARVLRVRDVRDERELAMKLLLPLARADEARSRFRREFRSLSRLSHPNILKVYEWGLHGDRPWFTMDLLSGHTLAEEAENLRLFQPDERFQRIQNIIVQLCSALSYIHDRGLIHRDITPGNIMIHEDQTVTLMDFGVVKDLGADLTAAGELVGTVAYMAPEQIRGEPLDARADLYSVGTVLYLLLTGKKPFQAHSLQGYLEKHLHQMPKRPQELDPLVPNSLDEICRRLIEKDPLQRYASASHLYHLIGGHPVEEESRSYWPTETVGRTTQKALLRESMDEIVTGNPGAAFTFTGDTGLGKTRMLDLADLFARRRGVTVARGKCRPQDRPFGAFTGVYRSLGEESAPLIIRQIFESVEQAEGLERYLILAAFRDYLLSHAPCVVLIDDLEKADPATIELIQYLIRNTVDIEKAPISFVFAHNSKQKSNLALFTGLDSMQYHHLEPLNASDVEELVLMLTENSPVAMVLAARIHQESNGSPAFIAEMLRGLVDEGHLSPNRNSTRYTIKLEPHEITRSRIPIPASLRQTIKKRLSPLQKDALEIMRILALSRRRLTLDTLIEAAPFGEQQVFELLDDLLDSQLIRDERVGEIEYVELTQSRMRDVILEGIPEPEFAKRHQRLGETLEHSFRHQIGEVVEELAFHFERAQLAPKAYHYLLRTADRHQNRSLFEESLFFLDRAIKMEPAARPLMPLHEADHRLAKLYAARAQAEDNAGRWQQALTEAQRALKIASELNDTRLICEESTQVGIHLRNVGKIDEAASHFRNALTKSKELGDPRLTPLPLYQLGSVYWSKGDSVIAEQHWLESLSVAKTINNLRHQAFAHNGLGILAACRGQSVEARKYLEKSTTIFEELGLIGPMGITQINLVELYYCSGSIRKALTLAEKTIRQGREINNPYGIAIGLGWRALLLFTVGRLHESVQNASEALRMIEEIGSTEDLAFSLIVMARVDLENKEPIHALSRLEKALPSLQNSDPEGLRPVAHALLAQSLAEQGEIEQAREVLKAFPLSEHEWPHIKVRAELARGEAWQKIGDHENSAAAFTEALSLAKTAGYRYYQFLAHNHLAQAEMSADARASHERTAKSLGRAIAANLPRIEAKSFLELRMNS